MSRRSTDRGGPVEWILSLLDRLFLAVLLLCPLAIGGVPARYQVGISLAVFAVGLPILALHLVSGKRVRIHLVTWVLLALGCWTLLRDFSVFGVLGAEVHRVVDGLWPDYRLGLLLAPAYGPLFALRTFALVVVLQVAALRFASKKGRGTIAMTLLGASAIAMVTGLIQQMTSAELILGFYKARDVFASMPLSGPMVNPNQSTALYALGPIVVLGWGGYPKKPASQILGWGLLFSSIALAIALSSRAVLLAIAVGTILTVVLRTIPSVNARRTLKIPALATFFAILITLAAVLLSGLADAMAAPFRIDEVDLLKTRLWRSLWSVVALAPWTGVGPGATQELLPWVLEEPRARLLYAESMPLQALIDHGALWFVALLAALVAPLAYSARKSHISTQRFLSLFGPLGFIATEAIGGMAMQSLAYSCLVAAWWGSMVPSTWESVEKPQQEKPAPSKVPAGWFMLAVCFAGSLIATSGLKRSFPWVNLDSTMPLASTMRERPLPWEQIHEERDAWSRATPANLDLIGQSARIALLQDDVERAHQLVSFLDQYAPGYPARGRVHLLLSRYERDPSRACKGISLVVRAGRQLHRTDLTLLGRSAEQWRACLKDHPELWEPVYFLLRSPEDAVDLTLLAETQLRHVPDHLPSLRAVTQRYLRDNMHAPATARARAWTTLEPDNIHAHAALARALAQQGESEAAWEILHERKELLASSDSAYAFRYLELSINRLKSSELSLRARQQEVEQLRALARTVEQRRQHYSPRLSRILAELAVLVEDWPEAQLRVEEYREHGGLPRVVDRLSESIEGGRMQQRMEQRLQRQEE